MRKILIIEDNEFLADGLRVNLENCGYEVRTAFMGEQAFELVKKEKIDLILLDVNLPDMDGFEICKKMKLQNNIPIIFLTVRDMEIDEIRGLSLGADDYIKKPFSVSVLQLRISAVLDRSSKVDKCDTWTDGYLTIDFEKLFILINDIKTPITSFEYKLLKLFIDNKNMVLTRRMLLEKLWDNDKEMYVEEHALTVSINRLRTKLESGDKKYIKTIYGMGYIWIGGEIIDK